MIRPYSPFDQVYYCSVEAEGLSYEKRKLIERLLSEDPWFHYEYKGFKSRHAEEKIFAQKMNMKHLTGTWNGIFCGTEFITNPNYIPQVHEKLIFSSEEEKLAFTQINYARFRISRLQSLAQKRKLSLAYKKCMLKWYKIHEELRESIILANFGLCLLIMKRYMKTSMADKEELLAEGRFALMRSVEKFDISRGFKFSTYACRAILQSMTRLTGKHHKYRNTVGITSSIDFPPDKAFHDDLDKNMRSEELHVLLDENRADLTDIEKKVLDSRFPMDPLVDKLTLKQIGDMIHLTKERVRQVQNQALSKLKDALVDEWSD